MSQARSKFRTTVLGGWVHAPRPRSEPPPDPEPVFRREPEPVFEPVPVASAENGKGSTQPGLVVWTPEPAPAQPQTTALARAWTSKVFILDEIDLPVRPDRRLVLLREPESASARGYRSLRHRLLAHSDPRVIAVTSAEPGEGKTSCAVNLALSL